MLIGVNNNSLGGLRFGTDGDGNCGYYGADGSLIPFSGGEVDAYLIYQNSPTTKNQYTNMPYTCPKKGTMVYKITSDSQAVSITKNGNTVASFTNTGGGAKTGNFSVNKGDILSYSLGDRSGHLNGIGIILAYN